VHLLTFTVLIASFQYQAKDKSQPRHNDAISTNVTQGLKTCHMSVYNHFTEPCSTIHLLHDTFNRIKYFVLTEVRLDD